MSEHKNSRINVESDLSFRCNHGWQGSLCTECIPMDGCSVHGSCSNEPFSCHCENSGWMGRLCECPKCRNGK